MSEIPPNGSPVSWRELALALEPLRDDLVELKADVKALRVAEARRAFFGQRGRSVADGLMIAIPAGVVSAVVAFLVGS